MRKYMLTFFGGNKALRYDNLGGVDKETREKHMAAWGAWMAELVEANRLEIGYPLESDGKKIDSDGTRDHHFPDTTEGGFIVIKAGSLDKAVEIAQSSPILKKGGYILVRPCGEMK
jgi:hypothetical protein